VVEEPPDQILEAIDFHASTTQVGDNPPTLMLIIDILHSETSMQWRQQLTFTRERWVALMQLLAFAADAEGVEWKQ
jgi:hypothetical protein